ncbi:MAG: ribbon-helix-helix protein, CopG family [Ardenticatenales bacterium]|nr:ribbon-helix-helix protein, CopG family [Ardenticatenales bacterium]
MDRVMVTMPDSLRRELDEAASAVTENRSEFVRRAVQERIERLQQRHFERRLAEAYQQAGEDPATDVQLVLGAQDAAAGQGWCWDD